MEDIEKTVKELDGMLPGLANSNRAGDYELLMAMGFMPLPAGTGRDAFFEWRREVCKDDDVIFVNVLLFPNSAAAYVSSRSFKFSGKADGKTVAEALKKALEMAIGGVK